MEVVWLSDVLMLQHVTTMRQRIIWIWIRASMTRVRIQVVRMSLPVTTMQVQFMTMGLAHSAAVKQVLRTLMGTM
jgi:hypothetical protein